MPVEDNPVHAGKKVTITWVNKGSEGNAVVHIGWRPKAGKPVPDGRTLKAAPGMSATHSQNVPADADALVLDYDLPDKDDAKASYRIKEGTTAVANRTVTSDGRSSVLVDP